MAKLDYKTYSSRSGSKDSDSKKDFKVGYFKTLVNDGDEAIVRFDYDDESDFDIVTVHRVKTGEKRYESISCLREKPFEPKSKCPFCSSDNKDFNVAVPKLYVKLIEYVKNPDGTVTPVAKTWERPAKIADEILAAQKEAIVDDLTYPAGTKIRDMVFRIRRVGAAWSMQTEYKIKALNPTMYKPEVFVPNFADFEGLDLAHHAYKVKTEEEIRAFLETGEFPVREKTKKVAEAEATMPELQAEPKVEATLETPAVSAEEKLTGTQAAARAAFAPIRETPAQTGGVQRNAPAPAGPRRFNI